MYSQNDPRGSIEADYEVRNGIIVSPGKFEGEPIYAPYYWEALMNGIADGDDGHVAWFRITKDDRKLFPELPKGKRTVRLREDDMGFVRTW